MDCTSSASHHKRMQGISWRHTSDFILPSMPAVALRCNSHHKPTAGHAFIQETCIRKVTQRPRPCRNASPPWLHGRECCALLSFMSPQTRLHQGWTFLCARFLPNNTRIRFDWCKSLIWLLLVMQACTQQLLCCDNLIFCAFGFVPFLLHYTEKKLCRVL